MFELYCNDQSEFLWFSLLSRFANDDDYTLFGVVGGQVTRVYSYETDVYVDWVSGERVEPTALVWLKVEN